MEASTAIGGATAGQFQGFLAFWSGRVDPDGNTFPYLGCTGSQNWGKYCNPAVDAALNAASKTSDDAERAALYAKATALWMADNPPSSSTTRNGSSGTRPGSRASAPSPTG